MKITYVVNLDLSFTSGVKRDSFPNPMLYFPGEPNLFLECYYQQIFAGHYSSNLALHKFFSMRVGEHGRLSQISRTPK
jgi:hypothetical protein